MSDDPTYLAQIEPYLEGMRKAACRRNEASLKARAGAGAMLVACRLAGLSGLEAHYADVDGYGQMRITSWLSAAQASYSDVFLELIKIEGRRNRRAAIWANKLATMRRTGESYSDVTCGSLSFEAQSRLARRSR